MHAVVLLYCTTLALLDITNPVQIAVVSFANYSKNREREPLHFLLNSQEAYLLCIIVIKINLYCHSKENPKGHSNYYYRGFDLILVLQRVLLKYGFVIPGKKLKKCGVTLCITLGRMWCFKQ